MQLGEMAARHWLLALGFGLDVGTALGSALLELLLLLLLLLCTIVRCTTASAGKDAGSCCVGPWLTALLNGAFKASPMCTLVHLPVLLWLLLLCVLL